MDLIALNKLAVSRQSARDFFSSFCWKNQPRYCPNCKGCDLEELPSGKYRCNQCGNLSDDFTSRFISACGFDFQQWLWFLKLFSLEVSNQELAMQLKVSYATVIKAKDIMRRAILAQAMDANVYYDLGIWPGPGRDKPQKELRHPPVIGIMELNRFVICDVLPEITPDTMLQFVHNFCLRTSRVGQVLYTAPFQQYQLLACCGREFSSAEFNHNSSELPADSFEFWKFVKQRLKGLRGIAPDKFPLHIKEWELRYNHKGSKMVPVLARALCSLIPDPYYT